MGVEKKRSNLQKSRTDLLASQKDKTSCHLEDILIPSGQTLRINDFQQNKVWLDATTTF